MQERQVTLREYQEHLFDRLRATAVSGVPASHLAFEAGTLAWVVHLADVSEVVPVPPLVSVPRTADWFVGVANVRGSLFAVTDLGRFANAAPTATTFDSRLLLLHARYRAHAALLVSRSLGLLQMKPLARRDLGGSSWQSTSYEDSEGHTWRELNVEALTRAPSFLQIALNTAQSSSSSAPISQENA